ncbi:MAG: lysoplasmalogenase [Desulfobacterales bacterium]
MNPGEKPVPAVYTLVFAAAAIVFMVLLAMDITGIVRTVFKAVPVSTLLVMVISEMNGFSRICLAGALFGSVCGDVLLDLPGQNVFVFGLAAFLAGHLFYTVLFFRNAARPGETEKVVIAGLIFFAGVLMWLFSDIAPELHGPVVAYIAVIVIMSIGALLVPAPDRLLFSGALVFIASDLVLAVNKFLIAIPAGRLINITLYFLAQYLIISAARRIWALSASRAIN